MDELLHKTGTKHILQLMIGLRENDAVFRRIWLERMDEWQQMFTDAIQQETDWAHYLFQYGSMIGLNTGILLDYLKYIAVESMDNIGIEVHIDRPKSNPLPWMRGWLSSDNVQVAPQETELESYQVANLDSDLDDMSEDEWEL